MERYAGFCIGQIVTLNESIVCEGVHYDKGHLFQIKSFPQKTMATKGGRKYFVYSRDSLYRPIRCEVDQIIK